MIAGTGDSLLRLIADATSSLMAYYDIASMRCRFANLSYARNYGLDTASILGRTLQEVVGEQAWEMIGPHVERVRAGQEVHYERMQEKPDRDRRLIQVDLLPHFDDSRAQQGMFVQISDVTEQRRAHQLINESEERMRKFAQATEEGIVFHANGLITDGNEAVERLLGYSVAEVLGRPVLDFVSDDTRHITHAHLRAKHEEPYEVVLVHRSGQRIPVEIVGKVMPVGTETYRLAVVRDISARKEAQARIEFMALHDALTRLPNRAFLVERLDLLLAHARHAGQAVAVLLLDLDNFKTVNDSLGHHAGDQLLCEVANRLADAVGHADLIARQGGDEFVVVLTDIGGQEDAARAADKLLDMFGDPMLIGGHKVSVSCSIGIGLFPDDGANADELIRHADVAMYHAKDNGRRNYQFFAPGMSSRAIEALDQESLLRDALAQEQFVLHYQPQVDATDGRLTGMEALVRWQHPTKGLVGPVEFIPFAEQRGLIAAIGRWVVVQACRQLKAWHDAGYPRVPVAVNLSAIEFRQRDLVSSIESALQEAELEPHFLEIELTESALLDHGGSIGERLRALKVLGVRLAIDDFGTGYSSLAYLKRYPIDRLKIDRSFVQDTPQDPDDVAIVTAILQMAHALKLATVAEGVETMAQLALVRSLGCGDCQGFLVARPMAPDQMAQFLRGPGMTGWTP